jgi:hypothetical protein
MPRAIRFHETGGPAELRYGQRVKIMGGQRPDHQAHPGGAGDPRPQVFRDRRAVPSDRIDRMITARRSRPKMRHGGPPMRPAPRT